MNDAVYRKTVWRLLLPIAILTFINSIDRMNVSFAAQQMSREVGLSPTTFGVGVSTFFIAYLLFQYPHALLLRRLGIRLWLLLSMTVWGIAGVMMSRLQDPQDFLVARFVLGAAEAGFAPGMTWYISQWTPRATRARAMAIALSAVPFSLVVGVSPTSRDICCAAKLTFIRSIELMKVRIAMGSSRRHTVLRYTASFTASPSCCSDLRDLQKVERVAPPSTTMLCPVMYPACSLHSSVTRAPISAGSPKRRAGI